jgi:glucosamine--fructose-6-phosphate aminotransferase (isomerizing)
MCGIVGIIGEQKVVPLLVEGLKRLEYRGYDSAGVATLSNGHIQRCRAEGKLERLESKLAEQTLQGTVGIGHTRWATHGLPNEKNAHPHASEHVAVVHNGIIENYAELKEELEQSQARFETDTDTEVIVHLVTHYSEAGDAAAGGRQYRLRQAARRIAVVMIFAGEHDLMIGTRQGTPLAVGYGDGEMFVASDSYALAPLTKKICFLRRRRPRESDARRGNRLRQRQPDRQTRNPHHRASGASTGKGEYPHFMLKEIYEQPAVIGDTLNSFINPATGRVNIPDEILAAIVAAPRVTLVACGTAYYACMVAKYWFERVARIPCEIDVAIGIQIPRSAAAGKRFGDFRFAIRRNPGYAGGAPLLQAPEAKNPFHR